jgi:hypothetical protein
MRVAHFDTIGCRIPFSISIDWVHTTMESPGIVGRSRGTGTLLPSHARLHLCSPARRGDRCAISALQASILPLRRG